MSVGSGFTFGEESSHFLMSIMSQASKDQLAIQVEEAYVSFNDALSAQRAFPKAAFGHLFDSVVRYFRATREDTLLHRCVVSNINGLRELIQVSKRRIPSGVLLQADRMECMIFSGHDPKEEVADLMDDD